MRTKFVTRKRVLIGTATFVLLSIAAVVFAAPALNITLPNFFPFPNSSGILETVSSTGSIDLNNPFFQSLGTNGRSCATCHLPDEGWTVAANVVQARFDLTAGLDPIFRTVDGSNCDHNIDVSTVGGRRSAYSLLTSRGVLRIALPVPTNAQFQVTGVQNPYGCNETDVLSMYRRPLPATNLRFLSTVMWDGRESTAPSTEKITYVTNPNDLLFDLAHQALDATNGHAQASTALTSIQQQEIVNFEMALSTTQAFDFQAGDLSANGATSGPANLAKQSFFVGSNDPLGNNPLNIPFTPTIFTLFSSWSSLQGPANSARASIARGEALFNSKPISITGVGGLNDALNLPVIPGTCGTCHDTLNVGNHSFPVPLNIGVGDPALSPLDLSYLPMMTFKNTATGQIIKTTDPGRAMVTGLWADIGKLKGPTLRGLTSRAPYFHNGSARSLLDVVNFYDVRFHIGFTAQEKADLIAFLSAL